MRNVVTPSQPGGFAETPIQMGEANGLSLVCGSAKAELNAPMLRPLAAFAGLNTPQLDGSIVSCLLVLYNYF